jgi:hypothetical protein
MVLGTGGGCLSTVGEGGKVRRWGGRAEGLCSEVYRGSKSTEAGVEILLRISRAASGDPSEAVMEVGREAGKDCLLICEAAKE